MPRSIPSTPTEAAPDVEAVDVSVVIVNYNVKALLEQVLRSLARAEADLNVEVFVVDNDSVDGSVEMVQAQFPKVRVIANRENLGFGKANNQAIDQARGRYIFVLNPDTIVQEDTLTAFVRFMDEHPDAGAAGCAILNPDGTFALESRRAFPTPAVAFYRVSGLSKLFPNSARFGRYNMTHLPRDQKAEVDALSGSCMFVRRSALAFTHDEAEAHRSAGHDPLDLMREGQSGSGPGGFDEDFFMYGEDLDWCYRIQQAGWRIYYTPSTQIIHYKGESTKKGELRYVRLFYGAMLLFARKHFRGQYSPVFEWLLQLSIVARAALTLTMNVLRRYRSPLLDGALSYGALASVAAWRAHQTGVDFLGPTLLGGVAPLFAVSTVLGIRAAKGYRRNHANRLGPALFGPTVGLLVLSATLYFIQDIAFSRVVVLGAFGVTAVLLAALRLVRRRREAAQALDGRRLVVVGPHAEAERLRTLLHDQPGSPFRLLGYVAADASAPPRPDDALKRMGGQHQLRDVVRLHQITDVAFAADGVAHHTMFHLMRQLHDLPVQFRIFAAGGDHLIGKASIQDLATPGLLQAEDALGDLGSATGRRAFEVSVAIVSGLLSPGIALWAKARPEGVAGRLRQRARQWPEVLAGKRPLIGRRPADAAHTELPDGVFAVPESLQPVPIRPDDLARTYSFYMRNRSVALDAEILWKALRNL
ncbi:MAG: glycosyltransferase family 2 protein [Bacteroidota bacterium]